EYATHIRSRREIADIESLAGKFRIKRRRVKRSTKCGEACARVGWVQKASDDDSICIPVSTGFLESYDRAVGMPNEINLRMALILCPIHNLMQHKGFALDGNCTT